MNKLVFMGYHCKEKNLFGEGGGVGKEELGDVFWGLLRLKAHLSTFK